jgi:hypothetical protein
MLAGKEKEYLDLSDAQFNFNAIFISSSFYTPTQAFKLVAVGRNDHLLITDGTQAGQRQTTAISI